MVDLTNKYACNIRGNAEIASYVVHDELYLSNASLANEKSKYCYRERT